MKKLNWESLNNNSNEVLEKKVKKHAEKLLRFCKKYGLTYCELYLVTSDNKEEKYRQSINARCKIGNEENVNIYAFCGGNDE